MWKNILCFFHTALGKSDPGGAVIAQFIGFNLLSDKGR